MSVSGKRIAYGVIVIALFAVLFASAMPSNSALAANITERSLTLEPGATDGGSMPSGVVKHLFTFTLPSTSAIQSIKFQYCTTADIDIGGTCTTPTGLSTASAAIGTSSGIGSSFSSINTATNGAPYVYSASGITPDGTSSASIELTTVTNPDGSDCGVGATNCTFFVRIFTYATNDATGAATDAGTVTASVSTQIRLNGTMPESLIFCTGGSISVNGSGIPDCTTATAGDITFNQLFSPTSTTYATSQMAASTNAGEGYVITVQGPTMTSGTNSIKAMGSTAALSAIGSGQFGMNLAADTAAPALTPASADVSPAPNGTNFMGKATTAFGTGGDAATALYAFDDTTANTIAKSDNGTGTSKPTDSQIFTSTYIVNVSGSQPAGTYQSTLTYICTPTF